MTSLGRFWVSVGAGVVPAAFGSLVVTVFGPPLFPLSLSNSEHPEDKTLYLFLAFFLCFGVSGFGLCWRLTRKFIEKSADHVSLKLGSADH